MQRTDDLRVLRVGPLIPPAILQEELPLSVSGAAMIRSARGAIGDVVHGRDRRLLVVVGPCSIHDPDAAREYAGRLVGQADRFSDDLLLVMRTYFEKPRSTVGWKGLINDPDLDGSFAINRGLRLARGLLLDLAELGLPVAGEFLDPISPQFIADLIAWGAIGARTTESQVHRELASGLSMPVGFKNATSGDADIAVAAVRAAMHPHHFLGVTKQGLSAIIATSGNPDCHVILRGGRVGPNHGPDVTGPLVKRLGSFGLPPRVMVDCSHGNSGKDFRRQPVDAASIGARLGDGDTDIMGVMLESFLVEGRQDLAPPLTRGQSVTDGCMGWETTLGVLEALAMGIADGRPRG